MKKALLLLEDGTCFEGTAAGKLGTATGEICFNTGMTGYQEVFTDPSYFGQILVATNAHIGNYGIKNGDAQSDNIQIAGFVCKNYNIKHSRPMADQGIQEYFENNNLVAISDVDTRAIVKHIRDKGAMNCIISSEILDKEELQKSLKDVPNMEGLELASKVTTNQAYTIGDEKSTIRIAVLDFGTKRNILECMSTRGAYLKVFPAKSSLAELNEFNPDGYFLSNGPGDPASMDYAIETIKEILPLQKPVFGICLGHQLLCQALGVSTYKMHHGHRGINHPVKNLETSTCEITSQNHGFGVSVDDIKAVEDKIKVTHVNLNDDTIEGIRSLEYNAFSVQYHPEACPGPHDSRYLFDQFIQTIKNSKN